ncbi:hypothetical protein NDU88_002077 [Pleurodeles waltl]|uniref:Uncharacterized protein n=1 Tax=Pleurodeles waltl TaxID=8319 RepID=A0AAV7P8Y2_PLEWA|nr:hypothetical protein NDU88_002077 [Pleurodeles waltl]
MRDVASGPVIPVHKRLVNALAKNNRWNPEPLLKRAAGKKLRQEEEATQRNAGRCVEKTLTEAGRSYLLGREPKRRLDAQGDR